MKDYLYAAGNVLLDLSPEVLIGAVLSALVLALATATLYQAVRRKKPEDNLTVMAGMILGANVLSMIVAASYISHELKPQRAAYSLGPMSPPGAHTYSRPYSSPPNQASISHPAPPLDAWGPQYLERGRARGTWDNIGPPRGSQGDSARARRMINDADTNHDGELSPKESERLMQKLGLQEGAREDETSSADNDHS